MAGFPFISNGSVDLYLAEEVPAVGEDPAAHQKEEEQEHRQEVGTEQTLALLQDSQTSFNNSMYMDFPGEKRPTLRMSEYLQNAKK